LNELDALAGKRDTYKNNVIYMQAIHNELTKSISYLKQMIEKQNEIYKVDDVGGGSNYLTYLLETETKLDNSIVNNAIPDMNRKVDEYNNKINEVKARNEAKEKEAAAQAAVSSERASAPTTPQPVSKGGGLMKGVISR
jgi:hypothetical protein